MDDRIWQSACLFFSFWAACCWESCSPISCVVEGRVTMTSTASRWQELFSWFLKLMVAFFQLENPRVTYTNVCREWHSIRVASFVADHNLFVIYCGSVAYSGVGRCFGIGGLGDSSGPAQRKKKHAMHAHNGGLGACPPENFGFHMAGE